ncbi:MAG: polyprenyl synthetase family protein [Sedimentisphaerales bacterium]|nr:polyprenyl synthetase family protein [Sedimentisphaerales bacterium]
MTEHKGTPLTFEDRYDQAVAELEKAMKGYLTPRESAIPETLRKAMYYSLQAGGKRLRPVMCLLACEACGGEDIVAMPAAAALEMVHTYSLIHDDLPAMDDDDLRRGQPTNHKVFGDAMAILAGDALLTFAFHLLALHVQYDNVVRQLVVELANASGAAGMISGQAQDILSEGVDGDLDTVNSIHTHKTAMMFQAATRMGAISARADQAKVDMLGDYGIKLGLAFQIVDDLLDVTSSAEAMGKKTQKDQQAGKLTYPAVVGIEQARQHANDLIEQAVAAIKPIGQAAKSLIELAQKVNQRNK